MSDLKNIYIPETDKFFSGQQNIKQKIQCFKA